jgi:hypothetical protein
MKLTLIKTPNAYNDYDNTSITLTTDETVVTLTEALRVYEDFLRGAGFAFKGSLEIVEDPIDVNEDL